MEVQNTFLDIVMLILIAIGAAAILALISLMITILISDVREFINSVKLKYKQKHRFDKAPTAKCYCVDCCYHDNETGRCCKFDLYTEDDWFCCDGEPRKTEVKKKCLKDL
jgi:hypothetical protein